MTLSLPTQAPHPEAEPAATLSSAALGDVVRSIIAEPASWRDLVRFTEDHRWFTRLALTPQYEVWLLSWLPGQHTGFHDHGAAVGAFGVTAGELRESLARPGSRRVGHRIAACRTVTPFGRQHLHDVGNVSTAPALSVHAYSPPLTAMRHYEMTPAGLVHVRTEQAESDW
ncbi:MAG TPA: cysteine dioxygenase family protein [Streptosporangiaceae bacterium]